MANNKGYFEWAPSDIDIPYLRMAVGVNIETGYIKSQMRRKLIEAVKTGVLPTYSGQLAALYRTIAYQYKWPDPHLWTKSWWVGCRFYVSREVFYNKIAPFLALLCGDNEGPRYFSHNGFGTTRQTGINQKERKLATTNTVPDSIFKALAEEDTRDPADVASVLDTINKSGVISCRYLVRNV